MVYYKGVLPDKTYHLEHHGIKGQKWGIRKYQNPDGSLTEEGKRRYGVGTESDIRTTKRLEKDVKRAWTSSGRAAAQQRLDQYRAGNNRAEIARRESRTRALKMAGKIALGTALAGAAAYGGAQWLKKANPEMFNKTIGQLTGSHVPVGKEVATGTASNMVGLRPGDVHNPIHGLVTGYPNGYTGRIADKYAYDFDTMGPYTQEGGAVGRFNESLNKGLKNNPTLDELARGDTFKEHAVMNQLTPSQLRPLDPYKTLKYVHTPELAEELGIGADRYANRNFGLHYDNAADKSAAAIPNTFVGNVGNWARDTWNNAFGGGQASAPASTNDAYNNTPGFSYGGGNPETGFSRNSFIPNDLNTVNSGTSISDENNRGNFFDNAGRWVNDTANNVGNWARDTWNNAFGGGQTSAPASNVPETVLREQTIPETILREQTIPETILREQTIPETILREQTIPEQYIREQTWDNVPTQTWDNLQGTTGRRVLGRVANTSISDSGRRAPSLEYLQELDSNSRPNNFANAKPASEYKPYQPTVGDYAAGVANRVGRVARTGLLLGGAGAAVAGGAIGARKLADRRRNNRMNNIMRSQYNSLRAQGRTSIPYEQWLANQGYAYLI